MNADSEPEAWLTAGRDYQQSYYSPLDDINKSNVRKLGFAWEYAFENYSSFEATPIVVDGVMFTSSTSGVVYALDARTGTARWTFIPDPTNAKFQHINGCCGAVNRGVAVWRGKVYVASFDGYLYAIDARNGGVMWKVDTIDDRSRSYTSTGAPYIAKDLVVIGNSGADFDARGYVTAYECATGKQAWRFFTVPGDPSKGYEHPELEMAAKTWDRNSRWDVGLGGTAWDGMAYDPLLGLLYVGTGNGTPWSRKHRSPGGGDNLFLASILAINPDNGRLVWHYQTVPGESWDYTATQKMILANLTIDGKPRHVLMQAPKNGFFYVLDRQTGELLSAKPYVKVTWASHVDMATGRPVETGQGDYSDEPKLVYPGAWGGHSWSPMAYHPGLGLVYLPAFDIPMVFEVPDIPFGRGQGNYAVHVPITVTGELPNVWPQVERLPHIDALTAPHSDHRSRAYLKAWDPVQQRVLWEVNTTTDSAGIVTGRSASGVIATGGGLVLQGRENGQFVILDATTGAELHSIAVGARMVAAPMTYKIGRDQFVAIMAADIQNGPNAKGRVLAFKLGGSSMPKRIVDGCEPLSDTGSMGTGEQVTLGRSLFQSHCSVCHSSGRAPDLSRKRSLAPVDFLDIVLRGRRADRGMGSFGAILSVEQANAIHAYLATLSCHPTGDHG